MATSICGVCKSAFSTEDAYVSHTCVVTGRTPAEATHFGTNFLRQSKEALKRSDSLTPEKEAEINAELAAAVEDNIDDKLMRVATGETQL